MIFKTKDLSSEQRAAIESLLGFPVPEGGAVSIFVVGGRNRLSSEQRTAVGNLLGRRILENGSFIIHAIEFLPEFSIGDRVSVRVGERNRTPHTGEVRAVAWHLKDHRYNYYLTEGRRKIKKRYSADDLEPAPRS